MKLRMKIFFLLVISFTVRCTLAYTAVEPLSFTDPLTTIQTESGNKIHVDTGVGSGATHLSGDPGNVIYTITDRGPVISTKDGKKRLGLKLKGKKGKIFLVPDFAPTIYKLQVSDSHIKVLKKIPLINDSGLPISGIPNPGTEKAWDIQGNPIKDDPAGLDPEGIVALTDGTFWLAEEYGPSLVHVDSNGRIIERWVPRGVEKSLTGAGYKIEEVLPAILRKRPLNRGIESIAISPDEKFLYFVMQSPLANPNKKAFTNSLNVRIIKMDWKTPKIVGEYVYRLDPPDSFTTDTDKKKRKRNDIKISAMSAIDTDILVILERITATSKFYRVELDKAQNILGTKWDEPTTSPSLEQTADIKTLAKKLLLNTDNMDGFIKKIEGIAWLDGSRWIMVNDNDFGVAGDKTFFIPVTMPVQ